MSNDATLAPARKARSKPRVKSTTTNTAAAPGADQAFGEAAELHRAFVEARDRITSLVRDAIDSEALRRGGSGGRVDRLLGMVLSGFGRVEIDTQRLDPEYMQQMDVASHANDAEAALFAAKHLLALELGSEGGYPSLEHALQIVGRLASALSGDEVYPVWDALRGPAPKPQQAPAARAGLSAAQLEIVLETVAGRTSTLRQTLSLLQADVITDEHARSILLDAAAAMTSTIGGMADDAIGGGIGGGADEWNYGPLFADEGKAVSA